MKLERCVCGGAPLSYGSIGGGYLCSRLCGRHVTSAVRDDAAIMWNAAMQALRGKSANAAALGKLGGSKGGKARAAKMTKRQRIESARKAAIARWGSKKKAVRK